MDILFMEDDDSLRKITCMRLKKHGFEPVGPEFTGADEGMECFMNTIAEREFDVMLLDLNWDSEYGADGLAAAKHIRQAFVDDEAARPRLLLWSANAASLSAEDTAVFDKVLKLKGTSEAVAEIVSALEDIEQKWLSRRDPAIGGSGVAVLAGPAG